MLPNAIRILLLVVLLLPSAARAEDAPPQPQPEPKPLTLDRFTGDIAIGTAALLKSETPALGTFRFGATRWFDNVGVVGAVGAAANGDTFGAGLDLGMRVLGSSGLSGPFAGAGFGVAYWDIRPKGGFRGDGTTPYGYAELGVIARGKFSVSLRADLLLIPFERTYDAGTGERKTERFSPLPLTAQIGFIF